MDGNAKSGHMGLHKHAGRIGSAHPAARWMHVVYPPYRLRFIRATCLTDIFLVMAYYGHDEEVVIGGFSG
jgi:hypothetical protein